MDTLPHLPHLPHGQRDSLVKQLVESLVEAVAFLILPAGLLPITRVHVPPPGALVVLGPPGSCMAVVLNVAVFIVVVLLDGLLLLLVLVLVLLLGLVGTGRLVFSLRQIHVLIRIIPIFSSSSVVRIASLGCFLLFLLLLLLIFFLYFLLVIHSIRFIDPIVIIHVLDQSDLDTLKETNAVDCATKV